jgi:3'(2'), 5'-bisphosphate nucleotidase
MSHVSLHHCLGRALLAAKAAGDAILVVYQGTIDVEYKDDRTPLTLADKQAHSVILNTLTPEGLSPIRVLSEEGSHTPYEERKGWEYFWLVDPLDGTKEFIKRRGEFSVNVALIHRGRPVVGVVAVPATDTLYFAAEGIGSYKLENTQALESAAAGAEPHQREAALLDGLIPLARALRCEDASLRTRDTLRVVGSRSHATEALHRFLERAKGSYGQVEFVAAGSALKFCLIAEGGADIYPRFGPTMEWDTGAGQCVVEQSGGAVLRLREGTPLEYNKEDLCNPHFVCLGERSSFVEHVLVEGTG